MPQLYDLFLFLNNPQVHFVLLMYLQDKAIYWSIVTFTRSYPERKLALPPPETMREGDLLIGPRLGVGSQMPISHSTMEC